MDASTVVWELVREGIIDDGDRAQLMSELNRRVQNQILHACFKQKCTWDAFNKVCDINNQSSRQSCDDCFGAWHAEETADR